MALSPSQQAQVDELKDLAPTGDLTDEQLWAIIQAAGSVNGAAARLWRKEAKTTAKYFNIREGSSSRNLGEVHKNALAMAELFEEKASEDPSAGGAPRTRAIVRPSWVS